MDIGHGLRLDTLRCIDDQDRAFAGGQTAGNLVGEIDVARRIEKIERVLQTILGLVLHRHRMGLDRDSTLTFQVHGIKQLILLVAISDRVGHLQQTVGEGGLPVINVGDDAEVSGKGCGHGQPFTIRQAAEAVNADGWGK